jgi:hypothetical protein
LIKYEHEIIYYKNVLRNNIYINALLYCCFVATYISQDDDKHTDDDDDDDDDGTYNGTMILYSFKS